MDATINVWCTLVMLNDSYAPGAVVVAQTLKESGTRYPIWCMVSDGVSTECEEFLTTQFDRVVRCPLIEHKTARLKSHKQNQIYGGWIHASYTKWNILNPLYFPVDKIILLDADMMVNKNIDHLFDLPAPALTFSSPWARPYVKDKKFQGCWNPYGEMQHGQVVDRKNIVRAFNKSILGLACMVLVTPNSNAFIKMLEILNRRPVYGYQECVSGFDEQLIADTLLAVGDPIHHIHQQYNWIVGKYDWLPNNEEPSTQQFYNGKPWIGVVDDESRKKIVDDGEWEDVKQWWTIVDRIIEDNIIYPDIKKWFYMG